MLDLNEMLKERGGDPKRIIENQRKRFASLSLVEEILSEHEDYRQAQYLVTQTGNKINALQKQIGDARRDGAATDKLVRAKEDLKSAKSDQEFSATEKLTRLRSKLKKVGNYVHPTVTVSNNEDDNIVLRSWTPATRSIGCKVELSHHEVLTKINGYDPERGVKIVGHRGYCLLGFGLFLNQALINYGLEFLHERGYKPNQPPYFMLREKMAKTAQLEDFDDELYKVSEDANASTEKYLIATSEQSLSALHEGEWLNDKELPIKYAGYSTCFRKEAGAHGKDAWGVFRVHQFEKIEQFVICKPDDSWMMFEEMISLSEDFYKSLGLPYQVVSIVSGALNNAASKKYDLEAWFPRQGEYKELVSCSNCTDYQTRELEIRYGIKKQKDVRKTYVHALNATLCATQRTLCCILENYQSEKGLLVPEVLRKYIPGCPNLIPYN